MKKRVFLIIESKFPTIALLKLVAPFSTKNFTASSFELKEALLMGEQS